MSHHRSCPLWWLIVLSITLGAALSSRAHAGSRSSFSMQFEFRLTDLDPADGIDPSLTWGRPDRLPSAYAGAWIGNATDLAAGHWEKVALTELFPTQAAELALEQTRVASRALGMEGAVITADVGDEDRTGYGEMVSYMPFLLGPGTEATFIAKVHAHTELDARAVASGDGADKTSFGLDLEIWNPLTGPPLPDARARFVRDLPEYIGPHDAIVDDKEDILQLTLANASDSGVASGLYWDMRNSTWSSLLMVPEASVGELAVGGLVGLGLAVCFRRRARPVALVAAR